MTDCNFQTGDKLRVIDDDHGPFGKAFPYEVGDIVTVAKVDFMNGVRLEGDESYAWKAERFEKVEFAIDAPGLRIYSDGSGSMSNGGITVTPSSIQIRPLTTPTSVIILPDDVDVHDIPQRSYDFSKGDRRFGDRQTAVDWASAQEDRYLVRRDPADTPGVELHMAQRLGS